MPTPYAEPGFLGRRIAASLSPITLRKVSEIGLRNAEENQPWIARGKSVLELRKTPLMHGESAIIVAAGPSLHRKNLAEQIKASGFKGPIIATESAMAYCLRKGIAPGLVVTLDPHPERIVRWFGDPSLDLEKLEQDDYFKRQDMDPAFREDQLRFNKELIGLVNLHARGLRVAVSSSASRAVVDRVYNAGMELYWWNPFYDDYDLPESLTRKVYAMNGLPCLNAGGNVGSACWVIAHAVLGKKQIAVVGMDFSYYGDTPYEKTQYYPEILDLVGSERLDEVFVRIRNPYTGQEHYTDPTYLWYRDSFLEMAQQAECKTFNCTEGGILFGPGIEWIPLSEFLVREVD